VGDPDREEVRAPVAARVRGELHVPALVRHARDDQAEAGPGIKAVMDEIQLARAVEDQDDGERGAEAADAGVDVLKVY
jgi:hypothetical protein